MDPQDNYYFRVVAANPTGFGQPSASSPPIRLRYLSTKIDDYNEENGGFSMNCKKIFKVL